MRILPFTERVRHGGFIFIYEKPTRCSCLGETFFQEAGFFFFRNVWTSIWDGSLVELNMTPEGAVCVSVARGWGGETPHGVAMVIIGFPIKVASSFIDYLPLPWQSITKPLNKTTSSKICLVFNTFFMPTKQGKHAKKLTF